MSAVKGSIGRVARGADCSKFAATARAAHVRTSECLVGR